MKPATNIFDVQPPSCRNQGGQITRAMSKQPKIDYTDRYNPEFIAWIDSINSGFQNMVPYRPFEEYCAQADQWLNEAEKVSIDDFATESEQLSWVMQQFDRFRLNTVYFLNLQGTYKDADRDDAAHMQANKAQKVILFLADNRYNFLAGKARQVTFTTAMGIYAMKKVSYVRDYFCKLITHNQVKGEEILRDKFKYPFTQLDDWARVSADTNFSTKKITTSSRGRTKADRLGTGATIEVCAPTDDAINGGSPNLVLIDEAGFIDNLTTIMREGRPTLFRRNPKTGRLEMKRQFIAWGTASMEGTKISYFKEAYQFAKRQWEERKFEYGIVPIFLNCFAREGFTQEDYEREKQLAESEEGMERESAIMKFHQHYPLTEEDMFVSGSKTLVPFNLINERLATIRHLHGNTKTEYPQYGYYDVMNGTLDDFLNLRKKEPPQPVWVRTKGPADPRTTGIMYAPPQKNWIWRYYKGTDPINTKTGHSKFAGSIWDDETHSIPSVINFRRPNFKECYLQGILQTLHYSNPHHAVREVCESNIGEAYMDMMEALGVKFRHLVLNTQLPPKLQTGESNDYGIRKTPANADKIIFNILDMMQNYMDRIEDETLFIQLKSFVQKERVSTGYVTYTKESKYDFDDVIDSGVYAFIGSLCFRQAPRCIEKEVTKPITKYVMDEGFRLRRARVYKNGRREYL